MVSWSPIIVSRGRGFWLGGITVHVHEGGNWGYGWKSRTNLLIQTVGDGEAPSSTGLIALASSPPVVAITNSHNLREIRWKPHFRELIIMERINFTIGSFFHLASRMHLLSFKECWTKFSLVGPLLGVTFMTWSFWARHHMSMWGICKPFLNGCGSGDCAYIMASAIFSMTD